MAELSNGDWYRQELSLVRTRERLEYLMDAIRYDKYEQEDYTYDVDLMDELRKIAASKLKELDTAKPSS